MWPDVLDSLGKTPREFGALHVHFEDAARIDGQRVVATVLLQGAFDPMPVGGRVALFEADGAGVSERVADFEVPSLADGLVVRVRVPLVTRGAPSHLAALVEVPEPSTRANRVRPAWKLHDTFEVPRLSEMNAVYSGEVNVGASLVGTALLGGAGVMLVGARGASLAANTSVTVHKARVLPQALMCALSARPSAPLEALHVEVLWRRGQPVPEAAPFVFTPATPVAPARDATRRCFSCGFEGSLAEYERARSCPSCGESWT